MPRPGNALPSRGRCRRWRVAVSMAVKHRKVGWVEGVCACVCGDVGVSVAPTFARDGRMSCLSEARTEERPHLVVYSLGLLPSVLTHCSVSRWRWLEAEAVHSDQEVLLQITQ